MPGPIKETEAPPRPLIEVLDRPSDDPASWPPVEDYITVSEYTAPSPGGVVTYRERYWERDRLEAWLQACPKETMLIALDPLNDGYDATAARPFILIYDGHPIAIPKGREVRVPAPLVSIIREGQQPLRTTQARGLDVYTIHLGADPSRPQGADLGTVGDLRR